MRSLHVAAARVARAVAASAGTRITAVHVPARGAARVACDGVARAHPAAAAARLLSTTTASVGGAAESVAAAPAGVDSAAVEIMFTLRDRPGGLSSVLGVFSRHGVNLSHIESRPTKTFRDGIKAYEFRVDLEGRPGEDRVRWRGAPASGASAHRAAGAPAPRRWALSWRICNATWMVVPTSCHRVWCRGFRRTCERRGRRPAIQPCHRLVARAHMCDDARLGMPLRTSPLRCSSDIDHFSTKTLDAGAELEADHPGFHDAEYRERRRMIVNNATTYKHGSTGTTARCVRPRHSHDTPLAVRRRRVHPPRRLHGE